MTNNEYTPTTDEVEENYVYGQMTLSAEDAGAEFDRWLEATIRQAKAEAFEEGWADHYVFPGSKRNPYRAKEEA